MAAVGLRCGGIDALSRDASVGPARSLQWVAGGYWDRWYRLGFAPSPTELISASGRVFLLERGSQGPPGERRDPLIIAKDAFNGLLLWKLRAAPSERRIVARGAVESLWPLHGSARQQAESGVMWGGPLGFLVPDVLKEPMTDKEAFGEDPPVVMRYGMFIKTVIDFLIIAVTLFFVLKTTNVMRRKDRESK